MARWRGGAVARWRGGAVARWRGGAVARWRGGAVARWHGGAVARWRGGAVARWRGGTVARWRGGAVARWRGGRWHGGTVARWHGGTVARWHGGTVARWHGGTVARWHGGTVAGTRGLSNECYVVLWQSVPSTLQTVVDSSLPNSLCSLTAAWLNDSREETSSWPSLEQFYLQPGRKMQNAYSSSGDWLLHNIKTYPFYSLGDASVTTYFPCDTGYRTNQ